DHEAGTRDMRKLNGLWKYMPYTAVLAMVAAGAMAGVPLLNGFLSKEMFFAKAAFLASDGIVGYWLPIAATIAGVFAVAYSLRFIHDVFFNGEPIDLPKTPHEPPRWMKVPVEFLVLICIAVGVVPGLTFGPLLAVAAGATLQANLPEYSLSVWHGFTPAVAMSLVALVGGVLVYVLRHWLFRLHDEVLPPLNAKAMFDWLEARLYRLAESVNQALHRPSLQRMVAVLVVAAAVAVGWGLRETPSLTGPMATSMPTPLGLAVALCVVAGAVGTVIWHRQRYLALLPLSVVGLMVALGFVKFSAPDLALTQLSVEMVTIVLLLLALYFLPQSTARESSGLRKGRDAVIALLAGTGASLLTWAVLTRPYQSIADYFIDNSLSGGGGTNVVNVILVDFRGFDTLGEISVLAIAAIGIFSMLEGLLLQAPGRDQDGRPWNWDKNPLIMAVFTRLLLPLALMVAVYILLRGHNLPGGGFIAGLIAAVALIMQYLGNGIHWTQSRISPKLNPFVGIGLLIATVTGLTSWWFGYPFLTTAFTHVHWPVVGDFEIASAMAFDLGVFLVVVGVTLVILVRLGKLHGVGTPDAEGN
ncbi:MAG: DUF4040 domain-containing protein, partial [Chromatiales bacterium]|nr:DUF4040 domain-containing protein [Chromatiales bacterium]